MKSSRLLLAATLVFLFILAVSIATAGTMGNGAAQRQRLVIESIDVTAGTIEFKSMVDQSIHTYKIDAATRVSIVNRKGTIDQIKAGMKVFNYTVKGGQTPVEGQTLAFIGVSPAAPMPAPPTNK
jgi:hypothetical protein